MKLHLPCSLRLSLLKSLTLAVLTLSPHLYASMHHSDVSLLTYTDFGQNMGRYRVQEVNSLLQSLNADGVRISYTGGQADYTLLHEMISFESQGDNGAYAAVGYGYIATVRHNGVQDGTFTNRYIGSDSAIRYASIEYRNSDTFRLDPTADFKISRQSKIITDVTPSEIYNGEALHTSNGLTEQLIYRAGAGAQQLADSKGNTAASRAGAYQYITGGINVVLSNGLYEEKAEVDKRGIVDDSASVSWWLRDWTSSGISDAYPLPDASLGGDSGSPMYIWDEDSQSYKYLAALQAGGSNFSIGRTASQWMIDTIASFDKTIDFSAENTGRTVYINGVVTDSGQTITDSDGQTANPWYGTVTNAEGETLVSFCGVKSGFQTWASLSSEMDKEKWYAYGNEFLNDGQSETARSNLFMTENLVFLADGESAETDIVLSADVDLGVGYVEFRGVEGASTSFHLRSQEGENHILSSAGYIVGAGTEVYLHLTNPSDYAREWRKTGEGNLHIQGEGDNYVALNLGGSGVTYLERSNGYAAYNVLANNGTTVVLQEGDGIRQIARDFTFGNGGATLDFNGNSMVWNNEAAVEEDGFSIHALTEDAVITNGKADSCTTLTVTQSGVWEFKGSFTDTADSALRLVYQGGEGGVWTLHSIHTNLQQEQSGLAIQSGTVCLEGSNTVHAMGSIDQPNSAGRYSNEDDWHYADASMNVTVQNGGTFELGSHARLTGDVNVEAGGVFLMREGVKHQYEYIEGWYTKEDTDAIRDYYGLKGNVHLAEGATIKVAFHEGTTSQLLYTSDITGEGNLSVDTQPDGGLLILSGQNTFSGEKELLNGRLLATSQEALGDVSTNRWVIRDGGSLSCESFTANVSSADILSFIDTSSTGALALTDSRTEQFDSSGHTGLIIGAMEGCTVQYGEAGTNELLAATPGSEGRGQWLLGGGGGELVVNFRLSGNNDLILGNEYQKGVVTLTNQHNDFSGDIRFTGGVTLQLANAGAIGNASVQLNYTNRLVSPNGIDNIGASSSGAVLLDETPGKNLDLTGHESLYLGSLHDSTYSGDLTLAEGQAYRFGATEATFTVRSQVGGAHDVVVDGQTYSGGRVVLTNIQQLTGSVSVMGRTDGYDTGDITLRVTQDDALSSASRVSLYWGGHLDIAGTDQTLHELNLGSGSILTSSAGGGIVRLHYDSQSILSGSLDVETIEKTGGGTLLFNGEGNTYTTFHFREGSATLMSNTGLSATGNAIFHQGTTLTINEGVTAEAGIQLDGGTVNISRATLGSTGSITALAGGGTLSLVAGASCTLNGSIGAVSGATLTVTGSTYNLAAQDSNLNGGTIDFQADRLNLSLAVADREQSVGGTLLINKETGSTTTLSSSGGRNNLIRTLNRVELGTGNTLLIQEASWNTIWNIHELAGEGTLQWNSATTHWYTSRLVLDGENSFTGNIILNRTAPTSRQEDRFYTGQMELAHNLAAQHAVVTLQGNNDYSIACLALNTENAHVVGLNGSAYSRLYAGEAITDPNGKGTTVDDVTTYTPPDSTRKATLTITGDGTYTFGGSVSAGAEDAYGVSLVMDGSGSQTFNGSSVALDNVEVRQGELHLNSEQLSVTGDISLAGGALLDMGDNFTLTEGQTLFASGVNREGASAPAQFTGNLTLAGGTLSFGELSSSSDLPTLSLGGVSFAEEMSLQTVAFTSTSSLQTGVSYLLVNGDWSALSSDNLSASFSSDYLTARLSAGDDGLRVTFSETEDFFIWQGTDEVFSWDSKAYGSEAALPSEATAVFNDSASNKTVLLTEAVAVDTVMFDNSQAATYLMESEGAGELTTQHLLKDGDGTATIRASVTVQGDTEVRGGVLIMEQGALMGDLNIQKGEMRLSGTAALGANGDGTLGTLNITEGGRLQVDAELHESERSLVLNQGEIFFGGAENELKSITSTGGSLSGAEGSRLTTETLDFAAGQTLAIEAVQVQVSQENTTRSLNGDSVTTLAPTQGGVLDDRNSYYNLSGTLNIGSTEEGSGSNGIVFINGICLSRQNAQSFLNVANGATLVVTGEEALTAASDGHFGSFNLSHWGSELRNNKKYNQVNIGGTLTINSIISAWDNAATVNLAEGGTFNLLKGLARNTNGRTYNITVNVGDGARLNAAGGVHQDSLVVNLKAGSTLGMVGQDVSLSNNLHLGANGNTGGVVTIDTRATQVEADSFAVKDLEEGGHIHLSGAINSLGKTGLDITGKGLLSLSGSLAVTDGLSIQQETTLSLSADGTEGVSLSSPPRAEAEAARLTGNATLSLSNGKASISGEEENRTHLDNVLVQLSEGSSLVLEHAVVEADSIVAGQAVAALAAADTAATPNAAVELRDVTLQCRVGTNTELNGEGTLAAGTQLFEVGGSGQAITLNAEGSVLQLSSDVLSHVSFSGNQVTLDFSGLESPDNFDFIAIQFSDSLLTNVSSSTLRISVDGEEQQNFVAYATSPEESTSTIYFATQLIPEPATTTLSLLALAALAARRRRK